jgi:sodium transport system ATP-binding protein
MSEVDLLCDELAIVHRGQLKFLDSMITFRERMKANNLTEEFIRIVQAPITTP